jgi:putative ABC transport system substrate-binding protein
MRNEKRRYLPRILVAFLVGVFVFSGPAQAKKKKKWKVAFFNQQLTQEVFDGLINGRNEAIKDCGLVEGEDYKIIMEKTFPATKEGGKAAAQATIKALDKGVDLVVTMGTAPSVGARKVLMRSSVPQIYFAVSDPVASEIITDYDKPGPNVTGVSYMSDPREQLKLARTLLPKGKTMAFVYMSTVPADLSRKRLYEELEAKGKTYGFKMVYADMSDEAAFLQQTSAGPIADAWLVWVGFAYNRELGYKGTEGMPYLGTSQRSLMQKDPHTPACISVDDYTIGRQAGVMVVKVINGEAEVGEITPEDPKKTVIYVNTSAALNFKDIVLSYDVLTKAAEIFGEITSAEEWIQRGSTESGGRMASEDYKDDDE